MTNEAEKRRGTPNSAAKTIFQYAKESLSEEEEENLPRALRTGIEGGDDDTTNKNLYRLYINLILSCRQIFKRSSGVLLSFTFPFFFARRKSGAGSLTFRASSAAAEER
jgi:hypothetical protein